MKTAVYACLLVILGVSALARELVPGVVSFDEPPGFVGFGPHHDPGDSPFNLSQTIRQYQPDHSHRNSFQQFDIGIGVVGYEFGNGKRITYRKLDDDGLKKELSGYALFQEATNHPSIQETTVSGRKAYFFTAGKPTPGFRKDAVFWREFYYIPFEPNRGVTLMIVADSEQGLADLRPLLKRVNIPADAHVIKPAPPPPPTLEQTQREQITRNLRLIAGAGDQCQLRHGRNKFTLAELRQDFGEELSKLRPVDGENYDELVWESGKPLRVTTHTWGEVKYPQ